MTLSENDIVSATFTATETGVFTFTLAVTDTFGLTDTDKAVITVTNQTPSADAGADQTIGQGDPVQLDGSASSDPNGDALTYGWTQTGGPTVHLQPSAIVSVTTFTAPSEPAVLTFTLTVTDTSGLTDQDTVAITTKYRTYLPLAFRNYP
jgi:hypothetical protein